MMLADNPWALSAIVVAAALVSDFWRVLGALVASRIDEGSQSFRYVKAVATALIAAVVLRLALYPSGVLANVPLALRIGSLVIGYAAYRLSRRSVTVGILVCEAVLVVGVIFL